MKLLPEEIEPKFRIEGGGKITFQRAGFFKCPKCKKFKDSECLIITKNEHGEKVAKCYKCGEESPEKDFSIVFRIGKVSKCRSCGTHISLTKQNVDMYDDITYFCYSCENIVAVKFGNRLILQPKNLFKPLKYSNFKNNSIHINDSIYVYQPNKIRKDDFWVFHNLQRMARYDTEGSFRYKYPVDKHIPLIFFNMDLNKFLGYILYENVKEFVILRQIYVVGEERKKGLATKFVKYFYDNVVGSAKKFVIERPNRYTERILINLGYAHKEGDEIVGDTVLFDYSGI